jgi:hypothetical protein
MSSKRYKVAKILEDVLVRISSEDSVIARNIGEIRKIAITMQENPETDIADAIADIDGSVSSSLTKMIKNTGYQPGLDLYIPGLEGIKGKLKQIQDGSKQYGEQTYWSSKNGGRKAVEDILVDLENLQSKVMSGIEEGVKAGKFKTNHVFVQRVKQQISGLREHLGDVKKGISEQYPLQAQPDQASMPDDPYAAFVLDGMSKVKEFLDKYGKNVSGSQETIIREKFLAARPIALLKKEYGYRDNKQTVGARTNNPEIVKAWSNLHSQALKTINDVSAEIDLLKEKRAKEDPFSALD